LQRPHAAIHAPRGAGLDAYEHAVTGPEQKLRIDKGTQNRIAELRFEPPQALRLCGCEPETGHFDEFTLDSP
jgi:hypothetical protein